MFSYCVQKGEKEEGMEEEEKKEEVGEVKPRRKGGNYEESGSCKEGKKRPSAILHYIWHLILSSLHASPSPSQGHVLLRFHAQAHIFDKAFLGVVGTARGNFMTLVVV